jgi:hypothetical protein
VVAVHLRSLDARGREHLSIGVAGVIGLGFGLYALLFPALGLLYLTDGYHSGGLLWDAMTGTFLVGVTVAIAGELVVSAAAVRMCLGGAWPGRTFLLGRPAAAITVAAFTLAGLIALVL